MMSIISNLIGFTRILNKHLYKIQRIYIQIFRHVIDALAFHSTWFIAHWSLAGISQFPPFKEKELVLYHVQHACSTSKLLLIVLYHVEYGCFTSKILDISNTYHWRISYMHHLMTIYVCSKANTYTTKIFNQYY